MVAHTFDPNTWEVKFYELEASLVYVRYMTDKAT